jgi:alpha/beta superfamily hydrolase
MDFNKIIEERVSLSNRTLTLEAVLAYPISSEPLFATLLCSPHPHFAGDMENNVIVALARDMASDGITLRFNYRGVGESTISLGDDDSVFDYWQTVEESFDYSDAIDDVSAVYSELVHVAGGLPTGIVGYSFGAAVGLEFGCRTDSVQVMAGVSPALSRVSFDFIKNDKLGKQCLILSGADDFVCSPSDVESLKSAAGSNMETCIIEGDDHFFRETETNVSKKVKKFMYNGIKHYKRKLNG